MGLITRMLIHDAVYWPPVGSDDKTDRHGKPLVGEPQDIKCRWEACSEEEVEDGSTRVLANHKVYVGVDLEEGGYLMLGTKKNLKKLNPPPEDTAHEIMGFKSLDKIRGNETVRWALL